MQTKTKEDCDARLSRIEGQVRGIARMIEDDRYCIDVLTQLRAVRAALRRVEDEVLNDHVAHCVEGAIASGDGAEQRRKVQELLEVLTRAGRVRVAADRRARRRSQSRLAVRRSPTAGSPPCALRHGQPAMGSTLTTSVRAKSSPRNRSGSARFLASA